jgi:hypothetical protein
MAMQSLSSLPFVFLLMCGTLGATTPAPSAAPNHPVVWGAASQGLECGVSMVPSRTQRALVLVTIKNVGGASVRFYDDQLPDLLTGWS